MNDSFLIGLSLLAHQSLNLKKPENILLAIALPNILQTITEKLTNTKKKKNTKKKQL